MVDRIIKLFENNGKSIRSILLELGFSPTDFNEWKKGKSKPTINKLLKIANYFNVSIDNLMGREVEHPNLM